MKKIPKFEIGDVVDIKSDMFGVDLLDVQANPWEVTEIKISATEETSYRLRSKKNMAFTGYFERALIFHKSNPVILFRAALAEEEELTTAAKYFNVYRHRSEVPPNSLVIGRYSTLPWYKELEEDLKTNNSELINSYSQHRWIADLKEWYEDFKDITPQTWTDLSSIPDNGPFILKGETNSKKFHWNTQMFAENKKKAIEIYNKLSEDTLIGQQDIYIRKYIPLKTFCVGINEMPITEEYRLFIYDGKVVSAGFYWSSHYDDLTDEQKASLNPKNIPTTFVKDVLTRVGSKARFVVVDIARTQDDNWIVIELNDGQQSGLSENKAEVLYKNIKNNLDFFKESL